MLRPPNMIEREPHCSKQPCGFFSSSTTTMVLPKEPSDQHNASIEEESEAEARLERQAPLEDPGRSPPATESSDSRTEIPAAGVQSATATAIEEPSNVPAASPTPPSTPPPPLPEPPRCWGVRAYDGGYYDVGLFYIFHPEAVSREDDGEEKRTRMPKGKSQAGDVDEDSRKPTSSARPFGYRFLEGLMVLDGRDGKEATGGSSEAAVQAFVELERQTVAVKRGVGYPSAAKGDVEETDSREGGDPVKGSGTSAGAGTGTGTGAGTGTARGEGGEQGSRGTSSCLVVGNTGDNETVRGLIRRGRAMWLGTFSLPPAPPGKEDEVLDLWPKKVLRFSEEGGPEEAVALEGAPDGADPLVPPEEPKEDGDEAGSGTRTARDGARTAYRLMAQALEDLRSFVEPPPKEELELRENNTQKRERDTEKEVEQKLNKEKRHEDHEQSGSLSKGSPAPDAPDEVEVPDTKRGERMDVATHNGNGAAHVTAHDDSGGDDAAGRERGHDDRATDCKPSGEYGQDRGPHSTASVGSGGGGGGRDSPNSRKRRRSEQRYPPHGPSSPGKNPKDDMMVDPTEGETESEREQGGREPRNCREDPEGDEGVGAGEMTVVAVRTSLLRNRADEDPNADDGKWENMVRSFIGYVESLSPGPVQEELSLMFAAALDPTLVRMRAANALLVRLAEECAMPDVDLEEDDEEYDDGDYRSGGSRGNGPATTSGFKVRLELDATPDGEEPPPEGVEYLLKTVGAARAVLVGAARARACMAAAGDTLGGLHELKADYKRSLPPGPREPIQSIIAEEQARVRGYATAHEEIANRRVHELRLRGRDVGSAYRAVEGEPGWSGVRRQVDAFLRRFAAYCGAQLPGEGSEPGLLGLDIALPKMADSWQ